MTRRSLKASTPGIQALKKALRKKQGGQTWLSGAVGCSRQTIWSLLQGNPTDCDVFMAVCGELGFSSWEEIAETEAVEIETIAPSNIDSLVREVRDRLKPLIEETCGTMRVLDMSYPIGLNDIYTDVNILERITSRRTLELAQIMREAGREQVDRICLGDVIEERVPALEAVERFSKLMILGKPGAGKTTFLKRLAMLCIGGKFKADHVPVFVTLKDFAEADRQPSLLEYLKQLAGESVEAIGQAGRAMILLDGLDEVREVDGDRVLRQIRAFSQQFAQNFFVITCRIAAREYTYEQFTEVEVADFDNKQIAEFSNNWFRSRNDAVKAKRFLEKLEEDKPIRELATSPLLLTLLCLVFEDSGDFPTNRAEMYQNGVDVLLKKWDVKRNIERGPVYRGLSLKRKKALLGRIARKTFETGNYFFKQREAERYISEYIQNLPDASTDSEALEVDSADVLKSIAAHHGLLVERASGIYSFSHLTFHEYFTAQEFANNSDPLVLKESLQILVNQVTDKRWREVFLLTVEEMLPNADYLLILMKERVDLLIARNQRLQRFMVWTNERTELYVTNKSSVRAFYFSFYLVRNMNLDVASFIERNHLQNLNLQRSLQLGEILTTAELFTCGDFLKYYPDESSARYYINTFQSKLIKTFEIEFDSEIVRDLELAYKYSFDLTHDNFLDELKHEPYLRLQELINESPDSFMPLEDYLCWWENYGEEWITALASLNIDIFEISRPWEFSDPEIELLKQYYDANKLLVDCLNSDCDISREVRQEIEETLLLPIAEIEAWKKNKEKS